MTVSSVIPATPAQAAVRKSPSPGLDDQSKGFYNILRLSTQDAAEGSPNADISERAAKTDKNEKQTNKKADTEQTAVNPIALPVPPQTSGPAPPLSIAALLGLPTHQSADVAETGKVESDSGQTALTPLNAGPSQQPAAHTGVAANTVPAANTIVPSQTVKLDFSNNIPSVSTQTEPNDDDEPEVNRSQPLQKADTTGAAPSDGPVHLPVTTVLQSRETVPSPSNVASSEAPQQSSQAGALPSGVASPKESSKPNSLPKDRGARTTAKVDPPAFLSVSPSQQPQEIAPLQESNQLKLPNPAGAVTADSQASESNVDPTAAGASPSAATSAAPAGNLAFALRLSENPSDSKPQSQSQETAPAESTAHAALASVTEAAAPADSQEKEQSHQRESSAGTPLYEVSPARPQSASDAPQGSSAEQPAPATAANLDPKHEAASSEPVRNVHMQVVGEDNSRVDVRLVDRGGELHVSVKSGDTNLVQNLQDHLPELTSRLDQQRFQTEVWIPKTAENGKAEMSGARDFSSNGNNSSNTNSNHSDQQGKKQQQYQPDWVDVLENSTRSAGKTNQTWLQ